MEIKLEIYYDGEFWYGRVAGEDTYAKDEDRNRLLDKLEESIIPLLAKPLDNIEAPTEVKIYFETTFYIDRYEHKFVGPR